MRTAYEIPTFDALFAPLIEALRGLGGSGSVEEIYAKTIEVAGISEEVASELHDPEKSNITKVALTSFGASFISICASFKL